MQRTGILVLHPPPPPDQKRARDSAWGSFFLMPIVGLLPQLADFCTQHRCMVTCGLDNCFVRTAGRYMFGGEQSSKREIDTGGVGSSERERETRLKPKGIKSLILAIWNSGRRYISMGKGLGK